MAAKQTELKGIERPKVQAIEDKAEVYVKSRDKRVKASKDEVADKVALIEEMKKHKLETYRLDTGEVVVITAGKAGVKVTEADDAESVDDGAEAESAH